MFLSTISKLFTTKIGLFTFLLLVIAINSVLIYLNADAFGFVEYLGNSTQKINSASDAIYLSVVTVTTLGYGDITPLSDLMKLVMAFEAVMGLVIFGLFLNAIARDQERTHDNKLRDQEKRINKKNERDLCKKHDLLVLRMEDSYDTYRNRIENLCMRALNSHEKLPVGRKVKNVDLAGFDSFRSFFFSELEKKELEHDRLELWNRVAIDSLLNDKKLLESFYVEQAAFVNSVERTLSAMSYYDREQYPLRLIGVCEDFHRVEITYSISSIKEVARALSDQVVRVMAGRFQYWVPRETFTESDEIYDDIVGLYSNRKYIDSEGLSDKG